MSAPVELFTIYLPVAGIHFNVLVLLLIGFTVGVCGGFFGIGANLVGKHHAVLLDSLSNPEQRGPLSVVEALIASSPLAVLRDQVSNLASGHRPGERHRRPHARADRSRRSK